MPDWFNTLPPQIYWPMLVLAGLSYYWPQIRVIWRDLLPMHRQHQRERTRLELLKLWYEVEAARKDAGVSETKQLPVYLRPPTDDSTGYGREPAPSTGEFRMRSRVFWAVAGALTISLLTFVVADLPKYLPLGFAPVIYLGIATRYVIFIAITASLALFIRFRDAKSAFMVGMVPTLLFQATLVKPLIGIVDVPN